MFENIPADVMDTAIFAAFTDDPDIEMAVDADGDLIFWNKASVVLAP